MDIGLFFFSSDEEASSLGKYDLVLHAARFADSHGLSAIWVPERHFASLGCLYPNPLVLLAACARETSRIALGTGSLVLPLHDPLRVAEELSMVDNLSQGRVRPAFASGWTPADFCFFPERYAKRHAYLESAIQSVRQLWRGETIERTAGDGQRVAVRIFPTPVQSQLPVAVTAAGNPATFEMAGRIGANLLTHMLDQDESGLKERIALYRRARGDAGHDPMAGRVTLMLHTFLGADHDQTRDAARAPLCNYLRANAGLLKGLAASRGRTANIDALPASEVDAFIGFLVDRFAAARALIGQPDRLIGFVERLAQAGVNEIASLLDFGPSTSEICDRLKYIATLAEAVREIRPMPADVAYEQPRSPIDAIRGRCPERLDGQGFYALAERFGATLGPSFKGIREVWLGTNEALARIEVPRGWNERPAGILRGRSIAIHNALMLPALLFGRALLEGQEDQASFMILPTGFTSHRELAELGPVIWAHMRRAEGATRPTQNQRRTVAGDVDMLAPDGTILIEVRGFGYAVLGDVDQSPSETASAIDVSDSVPSAAVTFKDASDLERLLRERVASVIGFRASEIAPSEPLRNLGLDSIMAIELRGVIERDLGYRVSIVRFLEGVTIRDLAAEIAIKPPQAIPNSPVEEGPQVVWLRQAHQGPCLVLVHALDGELFVYAPLLARLQADVPIVGLRLGTTVPEAVVTISELAAHYIEALDAQDLSGPYVMAGWSLGGALAQEMARQLEGQGRGADVALVMLIDVLAKAEDHSALFSPEKDLNSAQQVLDRLVERGASPDTLDPQKVHILFEARRRHQPNPYRGSMVLLRATEAPQPLMRDPGLGWSALSDRLEVVPIPGDHFTILSEPNISVLAQRIRHLLHKLATPGAKHEP